MQPTAAKPLRRSTQGVTPIKLPRLCRMTMVNRSRLENNRVQAFDKCRWKPRVEMLIIMDAH